MKLKAERQGEGKAAKHSDENYLDLGILRYFGLTAASLTGIAGCAGKTAPGVLFQSILFHQEGEEGVHRQGVGRRQSGHLQLGAQKNNQGPLRTKHIYKWCSDLGPTDLRP